MMAPSSLGVAMEGAVGGGPGHAHAHAGAGAVGSPRDSGGGASPLSPAQKPPLHGARRGRGGRRDPAEPKQNKTPFNFFSIGARAHGPRRSTPQRTRRCAQEGGGGGLP